MSAASGAVHELARVQRRTLWVLSLATMLGGLGAGATYSVGALLLAEVSNNDAISGLASAMFNLGAAIAGIPLARIASRHGRRRAIVIGNVTSFAGAIVAIVGVQLGQWIILSIGLALIGVSIAVQLLSRFAATDLAVPRRRARDLSLVVWSITLGAVVGPNLIGPGSVIGESFGISPLTGVYIFTIIAQLGAALVVWFGLRPDPLLTARTLPPSDDLSNTPREGSRDGSTQLPLLGRATQAAVVALIAISQAVMVALMAMTPLHLMYSGGSNELIGFTISLHIAGMYMFAPVFGILAGRFGRVFVIHLGWIILAASAVIAYAWNDSHTLILVSLTLLGLGWSAVTVAGATLITEITPETVRTKRQGQADTVMSGSGALAGALSGVLFAVGGFGFLAIVSAFLIAIGVLLTLHVSMRARAASH